MRCCQSTGEAGRVRVAASAAASAAFTRPSRSANRGHCSSSASDARCSSAARSHSCNQHAAGLRNIQQDVMAAGSVNQQPSGSIWGLFPGCCWASGQAHLEQALGKLLGTPSQQRRLAIAFWGCCSRCCIEAPRQERCIQVAHGLAPRFAQRSFVGRQRGVLCCMGTPAACRSGLMWRVWREPAPRAQIPGLGVVWKIRLQAGIDCLMRQAPPKVNCAALPFPCEHNKRGLGYRDMAAYDDLGRKGVVTSAMAATPGKLKACSASRKRARVATVAGSSASAPRNTTSATAPLSTLATAASDSCPSAGAAPASPASKGSLIVKTYHAWPLGPSELTHGSCAEGWVDDAHPSVSGDQASHMLLGHSPCKHN